MVIADHRNQAVANGQDFVAAIRRWWWLIVLALVASLAIGWVLTPNPAWTTSFRATVVIPGDTEDTGSAERPELMVLDDLGREKPTEWVQETLYLVVNARYEACLATSVTTNLEPDALRARIGESVVDRLAETNKTYWCQWASHRRRRPGTV